MCDKRPDNRGNTCRRVIVSPLKGDAGRTSPTGRAPLSSGQRPPRCFTPHAEEAAVPVSIRQRRVQLGAITPTTGIDAVALAVHGWPGVAGVGR